ncbi:MAG: SGNH/GDSL hydrolase family protein [Planctomycetota bacterium]
MKRILGLCIMLAATSSATETVRVDVNAMPRVVFTGDSQTCGRVGARDYPQMLSWEMPVRVINTGVGGTNTTHLLSETSGGSAQVAKGEKVVKGTKVGWGAGPYPGQKIRLGRREYVIDRIEVVSHADRQANLWLTEPAQEDFAGGDYAIEAGWRVRVAQYRPDYACFMYSVNDTGRTSEQFIENLKEIVERTKTLGAQPILLSGVPLMDAAKGGSHPGGNDRVKVRERDLIEFSSRNDIPFGNVFGVLMLLDEPCTAVWVDTVHPTTDGSLAALNALRSIFRDLGLADNPYYVRGYRAAAELASPETGLVTFTTSQPDYDVSNRPNESQFSLKAIHVRDEYGLISSADGEAVESETPIVLEFGVGDAEAVGSAQVEIVTPSEVRVAWFDWDKEAWQDLARGRGRIAAGIPKDALRGACRKGAIWLAVSGGGKIALDYAAVVLGGDVAPFRPKRAKGPIVWPRAGELEWQAEDNRVANGDLTEAGDGAPAHWRRQGDQALYLRPGVVAEGTGGFTKGRLIDLFKSAGQQFTRTVRPLDMLTVAEGPEGALGNFLIAQVVDDETVRVRRFPKDEASGLRFRIARTSGCGAVPGGCMIESRGESGWETAVRIAEPGRYRLGFFFRVYDPANMNAADRPGDAASVTVGIGGNTLAAADSLESSYQWQRKWLEFDAPQAGQIVIRASSKSDVAVQYTGFTAQKR